MPWTGPQFKAKHNHSLNSDQAGKAAAIATAMIGRGVPEGEAIATGNKRAEHPAVRRKMLADALLRK